jgi:hypothetical protein
VPKKTVDLEARERVPLATKKEETYKFCWKDLLLLSRFLIEIIEFSHLA